MSDDRISHEASPLSIGPWRADQRVLVIAEIGQNHEGSHARAEEMVVRAAEAGADAVKFQTFTTERFISPRDEDRFERMKRYELTHEEFSLLAKAAENAGVLFLSTPFDLPSVEFLDGIVSAFKVASCDTTFFPLLDAVGRTGKPVILSTGASELSEVEQAVAVLRQAFHEEGKPENLAVLHCVSSYPTPIEQANVAVVRTLRQRLGCTVGFSDHTLGLDAAVLAVAAGARVIEKHFTLDKELSEFRDHKLSVDPEELPELVAAIRRAEAILGDGEKRIMECERDAVPAIRRSIAANRDLPEGWVVTADDIVWLRPGDGLSPGSEALVFGRRLRAPVRAGDPITLDGLAPVD